MTELHCAWGLSGLRSLSPAVTVVVDVLSFSTCVDVACGRGAAVIPWPMGREGAAREAARRDAVLARRRSEGGISLSPPTLAGLSRKDRLLLPSPNGARISFAADGVTFAGCLRNVSAVARAAQAAAQGGPIAVIPAGERWPDGGLRPAIEDLLGAGAILAALSGRPSPEAQTAMDAFRAAENHLPERIRACVSGRELIDRGYPQDVAAALAFDRSEQAPRLVDGAFRA